MGNIVACLSNLNPDLSTTKPRRNGRERQVSDSGQAYPHLSGSQVQQLVEDGVDVLHVALDQLELLARKPDWLKDSMSETGRGRAKWQIPHSFRRPRKRRRRKRHEDSFRDTGNGWQSKEGQAAKKKKKKRHERSNERCPNHEMDREGYELGYPPEKRSHRVQRRPVADGGYRNYATRGEGSDQTSVEGGGIQHQQYAPSTTHRDLLVDLPSSSSGYGGPRQAYYDYQPDVRTSSEAQAQGRKNHRNNRASARPMSRDIEAGPRGLDSQQTQQRPPPKQRSLHRSTPGILPTLADLATFKPSPEAQLGEPPPHGSAVRPKSLTRLPRIPDPRGCPVSRGRQGPRRIRPQGRVEASPLSDTRFSNDVACHEQMNWCQPDNNLGTWKTLNGSAGRAGGDAVSRVSDPNEEGTSDGSRQSAKKE
ncbi:MAG: hypothetical protein M1833_006067 [Piccolia ochrophora]|nr:MAG: hypothetical protein M1833_006067 [Piccolia ochrophora]